MLHATTGVLEVYALIGGASSALIGNVLLRAVVVALFAIYSRHYIVEPSRAGADRLKVSAV